MVLRAFSRSTLYIFIVAGASLLSSFSIIRSMVPSMAWHLSTFTDDSIASSPHLITSNLSKVVLLMSFPNSVSGLFLCFVVLPKGCFQMLVLFFRCFAPGNFLHNNEYSKAEWIYSCHQLPTRSKINFSDPTASRSPGITLYTQYKLLLTRARACFDQNSLCWVL